jgi:hypothetical protein
MIEQIDTGLLYGLIPVAILLLLALFDAEKKKPEGAKYPPGPTRKPLIGNLLDVSQLHGLTFHKVAFV